LNVDESIIGESAEELYESAPCGYLSTLPDGRIVRVNRTFLDWTGYTREELLRLRFSNLLPAPGKIFHETHFSPLLDMQGFANEIAFDLVRADGRLLPVLVNTVQQRGSQGAPLLRRTTVFNATDRRRYERELLEARRRAEQAASDLKRLNDTLAERVEAEVAERLKAEAALRQAQKMEAVGQLTGGVAHDFNNLLTIISGNLELLMRQLPGDAARPRRLAEAAIQGARRAATLTQRLLAFSRRQPLDPKPVDPNRLVASISDMLRRTLGETVALETVLAAGLWQTRVDGNQLENALVNLAVNARDAMPDGGKLTVETANASLDESYVATVPEPVPAGQYVMIAVSDTGSGIDKATLERVFEPFFTTKEPGRGTGLGLSQVYGFVRQSGGHVRIYSEVGHGTTVKLYLPRLMGAAGEPGGARREPLTAPRGEGETILLVEDEDELRAFAAEALEDLGYRVLEAWDAETALNLLDREGHIALLFTDVVLPGGTNGRALADEIVRRLPETRVLFTTGYTRNAIVHQGRLDPGVHLLGKPFSYSELAVKVRRVLDGGLHAA
jgi:PAS domain S-box-containing protein